MSQSKSEVNTNYYNNNRAITYNAGEDIARFEKNKRAELQEHQNTIDIMGRFHELWTGNLDDAVMEIKMQALLFDVKRQLQFLTNDGAKGASKATSLGQKLHSKTSDHGGPSEPSFRAQRLRAHDRGSTNA